MSAAQSPASTSRTPWPDGSATGVGSMSGTDIAGAFALVLDTLPDFPHLPELPDRGPGAEITGRTLALMTGMPAQWGSNGWVFTDRPGRDLGRAAGYLHEDLDVAESMLQGWHGPLKIQVCGPWTLAATVELRSGRRALADAGAVRDLRQALTQAVAEHVAQVQARVPGAAVVVQVDEPALPAVLRGSVPTPSGLTTLAGVDEVDVQNALREVLAALPAGVWSCLHCCAAAAPVAALVGSGFDALSLDGTLLTAGDDDPLAEAVEGGMSLLLGLVPVGGDAASPATAHDLAAPARTLWQRTGLAPAGLAQVAVTPTCGLAGGSPSQDRSRLELCRAIARSLTDDPEQNGG